MLCGRRSCFLFVLSVLGMFMYINFQISNESAFRLKHHNSIRTRNRSAPVSNYKIQRNYLVCSNEGTWRLGNLMFALASCIGIAKTIEYEYVIKPTHLLLRHFDIEQVSNNEIKNILSIDEDQWKDKNWRENTTYLSRNLTLTGYLQSYKYFNNVPQILRKTFKIKRGYNDQASTFLKEKTPTEKTLIGIHVRRTDFMTHFAKYEGRVVADGNYTRKAMSAFRAQYIDAFFVVVSDDQDWCKENIKGNDVTFSPFKEPIVDMAILSLCDHVIITAGTFGWWGAWLANGTTVYLKDFPKHGSGLEKYMPHEDYYYPHWIGLSNGWW